MNDITELAKKAIAAVQQKDFEGSRKFGLLADLSRIKVAERKRFPNGFESWHETHFRVVAYIIGYMEHMVNIESDDECAIARKFLSCGSSGLMELAAEWTTAFEKEHSEVSKWIVKDWYDTVNDFCNQKNNNK